MRRTVAAALGIAALPLAAQQPEFVTRTEAAPVARMWPVEAPERWVLAFLDIETTGLVPGWHEPIDLGIVWTTMDGRVLDSLFLRVMPDYPDRLSEGARAVNAFDAARWRALGAITTSLAVDSLLTMQRRVVGDRDVMLAAFNSWFDSAFLDHLFRAAGRSWREGFHYFVLDVPSMAWGQGLTHLTGAGLAGELGVPDEPHVAEEHTGLTGALLNVRIYRALLARLEAP